jgi:SAM-dependent methyltransferase
MELGPPPVPLVQEISQTLRPGRALDLACGSGRNAFWLAQNAWDVTAVDRTAGLEGHGIHATVADLEAGEYKIEEGVWDLIVISYYLQRNLFEPAIAGLKPGDCRHRLDERGRRRSSTLSDETWRTHSLLGWLRDSSLLRRSSQRRLPPPLHRRGRGAQVRILKLPAGIICAHQLLKIRQPLIQRTRNHRK